MLRSILVGLVMGLLLFVCACNDAGPGPAVSNIWVNLAAFPGFPFDSVRLYTIPDQHPVKITSDSGAYEDTSKVRRVGGGGYSFIAADGRPMIDSAQYYTLDTAAIGQLERLLRYQPCVDSLIRQKSCTPQYRTVFVFYAVAHGRVALAHIDTQCQTAVFDPAQDAMCNFDNKADFQALQHLIAQITKARSH